MKRLTMIRTPGFGKTASSRMRRIPVPVFLGGLFCCLCLLPLTTEAGDLNVKLTGDDSDITLFGAIYRWDADGLPKKANGQPLIVDTKAVITEPYVDARAVRQKPGLWTFENLPPGVYDLIIIKAGKQQRFEGFRFAPVLDFDPFLPPDARVLHDIEEDGVVREKVEDKESCDYVVEQITTAPHYENKVVPVYLGGNYKRGQSKPKFIRALVMLLRDETTTYEGDVAGAATIRFEIWQFDDKTGTYVKNRKTHVLHRILTTRSDIRRWTWLWVPELGDITVPRSGTKTVEWTVPNPQASPELKGLRPY